MSNMELCGECGRDINDCPWLHKGEPVDNWRAYPTTICYDRGTVTNSYQIEYCPLYEAPKPRAKNKAVLTPEQDRLFFRRQAEKYGRQGQLWRRPGSKEREGE